MPQNSVKIANDEAEQKAGKVLKSKGLNQTKLAKKLNIAKSTVSNFFNNKPIEAENFRNICDELGLDYYEMAGNKPISNSSTETENTKTTNIDEPVKTVKDSINWHSVCRVTLEQQCRTTSNHLMQEESAKKNIKQIYVPLGLVGKKKQDKLQKINFSPDSGTSLYEPQHEIEQRFEHEAFLTQILENGEGKINRLILVYIFIFYFVLIFVMLFHTF
ncbi:hypothetical protein NIES267_41730 [Calothrix parasitica NIES-267]|uniref:HTH cro/C1-type domain-containing protein n=1 Tax=Calothrix parasitica NIES-267 TaxID=1973488 RepID=A0A1Z4LTV6_9CYAN|nr:hypothetical protein NIES267_41730 [Calothrix parasitica NIES-267]